MAEPRRRTVSFETFRQAVRRHRPSELLPTLAQMSVHLGDPPFDVNVLRTVSPWFTAVAARESILWGNEHRADRNEQRHLVQLVNLFNDIDSDTDPKVGVSSSIIRTVHEQFPFQESVGGELARLHVMLVEPLDQDLPLEVIDAHVWESLLGAPLGQAVGATFLHYVSALHLGGRLDLSFLSLPGFETVNDVWPAEAINATTDRLTLEVTEFKRDYETVHPDPYRYQRHGYNPLVKSPFIELPNGLVLAPQHQFILKTLTPGALFYPGVQRFGEAFARDLGVLAEHYVGRQLRTIPDVQIHGEIEYERGQKSIDWIVVFSDLVLLVEVKSRRMSTTDTAHTVDLAMKTANVIERANKQLQRTYDLITGAHQAFEDIPTDRPFVGLAVTTEPLYFGNSGWVREHLSDRPFPTLCASLKDLETLVLLPTEAISESLRRIATDEELRTWYLGISLSQVNEKDAFDKGNSLLPDVWSVYPWPAGLDDEAD